MTADWQGILAKPCIASRVVVSDEGGNFLRRYFEKNEA